MAEAELNSLVLALIAKLKEDDARDAFAEYARWTRARDRKCDLDDKDNVPLQELSFAESCLAEYINQKQRRSLQPRAIPSGFLDGMCPRPCLMPTELICAWRKSTRPIPAMIF
jgi:hypothetical protein